MITPYIENNKTLYKVFIKGRDKSGRQIGRRRQGITSKRKAEEVEYELKKEIEGSAGDETTWTWDQWHFECLKRMRMELKQGTVMGYDGDLKKWLPKEWKEKELSKISKNDVHELIFEIIGERSTANVKKNVYKRVRRILEMALEDGLIPRNPAAGITVKIPEPVKKVLNSNEAIRLLQAGKECQHRFYPIWAFALFTGMRSGEMYSLQWKDIDLETGLVSVTKQWTSKDGLHATKSNKNRVVPISPELKVLLLELRAMGPFKEKMHVSKDFALNKDLGTGEGQDRFVSDLVLPRLSEWRCGMQADVLRDFCRGIGITAVKFHDLRATFITNLLAQGVSLPKVMAIVGHNKMATTNEYLRLAGVDIKDGTTEKLGYTLPKNTDGNVVQLFSQRGPA